MNDDYSLLFVFRFINRIAKHPILCADNDFIDFVELDGEMPKSGTASALSGAGFVRLLNKVGDSIGKMTYTMVETDEVSFGSHLMCYLLSGYF